MPTFQEIIQSPKAQALIAQIPFDADYASLNKLKFSTQELTALSKQYYDAQDEASEAIKQRIYETIEKIKEIKEHFYQFQNSPAEAMTKWQQHVVKKYTSEPGNFIDFLQKESQSYLPAVYAHPPEQPTMAEIRFPSAESTRNKGADFAHLQKPSNQPNSTGGLLASHVPHTTLGQPAIDRQNMQTFLGMLLQYRVEYILSLGGSKDRLNYREWSTDTLQTSTQSTHQESLLSHQNNTTPKIEVIKLTDTATGETILISYASFTVADNEPLNLNNDDLSRLLEIYDIYQKNVVLVHCDSGVGRTGQVRLLFALLDQYNDSQDTSFKDTCDSLLETLSNKSELDTASIATILKTMQSTLAALRQTRYCIQAPAQFTSSLVQLILLLAVRMNYDSTMLNTLREQMGIAAPLTYSTSTDIGIIVEGDSDDDSQSAAPSGTVSPRRPIRPTLSTRSSESTLSRAASPERHRPGVSGTASPAKSRPSSRDTSNPSPPLSDVGSPQGESIAPQRERFFRPSRLPQRQPEAASDSNPNSAPSSPT